MKFFLTNGIFSLRLSSFIIVLIQLSLAACHKEENTPGSSPAPSLTALDDAIRAKMSEYNIPGLSLAIAKDDKIIYAQSYGLADKEANQAASNNDLYRIGSISKTITAIAILKLADEGLIDLNRNVFGNNGILGNDFGTPPEGSNKELITVQNLLDHVSGWTNDPDDPTFDNLSWTQAQMITDMVENRPLTYAPGTTTYYLNFGFIVLGRVIEKITNTSYENYVKTSLLSPMGITDMRIGGNTLAQRYPGEVKYYTQAGYPADWPYSFDVTRGDAAGGWIGSSSDLIKFIERIDRNPSVPDIISATRLNAELYFGFSSWTYNGSIPGSNSTLSRLNDNFSFAFLMNTRNEDELNDAIFNDLYTAVGDQILSIPSWPGSNVKNPLSGTYQWRYRRWDAADTTLDVSMTISDTIAWEADSGVQLEFWGGYAKSVVINAPYTLTFSQRGTGVMTDFQVKIDPSLAGGLTSKGITITQSPAIIKMTLAPSGRYFKIWYKVENSSGDTRTFIDEYWL